MSDNQSEINLEKDIERKEFIPGAMGERIAYLRKSRKLTQAQVAEQLGISAQAVSKWESGLSCPDIMTLVPLAQVLKVSTDELLGVQLKGADQTLGNQALGNPALENRTMENRTAENRFAENQTSENRAAENQTSENRAVENQTSENRASENQASEPGGGERGAAASESLSGSTEETWEAESEQSVSRSLMVVPSEEGGAYDIREFSVSAGACVVNIKNGDDFCLELEGYQEGEVISEVKKGIWTVRDIADKHLLRIGRNTFSKRKMVITLPEGYFFDAVKLNIGAGTLTGAGIHSKESTLSVGAGQVTMKDFISNASKITCGMGEIVVRGELYGKCSIDCGMGSVKVFIKEPEHYGYRTSVGMGEVRIGENRLSGIGGSQTMNAGDPNFYKISCSMGMVSVSFAD